MEKANIGMDEYLADRLDQEDENTENSVATQELQGVEEMERGNKGAREKMWGTQRKKDSKAYFEDRAVFVFGHLPSCGGSVPRGIGGRVPWPRAIIMYGARA